MKPSKAVDGPHIDGIPRDVWPELFFEDPLAVSRENAAVTLIEPPPETANPKPPAAEPSPAETPPASHSQPADDWATLLSGDDFAAEAKAIRASLNDKLKAVGRYKTSYKDVRVDAGTLAALAALAPDHPDPPSWKDNARFIRDAAAAITQSATGSAEKSYQTTREAFDKIDAMMSGSRPPGVGEAAERVAISELVSRGPLMFRLERAFNFMKRTVNNESALKKNRSKVTHEGAVLATLGRVIADPGYVDADLHDYQKYARELQQSGQEVVAAVANSDFKAYSAALDRASKACTECHSNFKNN